MTEKPAFRSATWIRFLAVVMLWAAAVAGYARFQKPVSHNRGLGWDGAKYHEMYSQAAQGARFQGEKPYIYRIATPWLAARLGFQEARTAFHFVNLGAVLITGLLLLAIMGAIRVRPWIAVFLVGLFFAQWHGPLRQQFYDSFCVDAASQPFTCLIFLAHLAMRRSGSRIGLLSLTAFLGVFFRESVLFAAFAVWAAEAVDRARSLPRDGLVKGLIRDRGLWRSALPMAAGLAGIVLTRLLADGSGSYSFPLTILYYLYHKPLMVLIHAFYNGYGTVLIPVLVYWRWAWAHIRDRPLLGIYPLITFALGWTAGGDTTRINFWGCFALLPLIGLALSDLKLATFGIGVFLALEAVTTRLFLPIPDFPGSEAWRVPFLTGWGSDFPVFDLWSELANPRVLMISLFQYLALTVFAFLWIHRIGPEKYLRIEAGR